MWSKRLPRVLAPIPPDAAHAPSRNAWLGLLATCVGLAGACTEDPYPTPITPPQRKVSEEIFFIVCKRVAHDAFANNDASGLRFDDACDGGLDTSGAVGTAPRLAALVARRARVVEALDQAFGDEMVPDSAGFEDGELDRFLLDIVPYYDPPELVLPTSTRAIGNMLKELVKPLDPVSAEPLMPGPQGTRAKKVLETLARIGERKGYRQASRTLGAIRPVLTYPRLDEVGQQLLGLVADGGTGREAFMATLRAAALELAEPREPEANPDDTTLHLVLDQLLLQEDPVFAEPGLPELLVLKRDRNGDALPKDGLPQGPLPTPFIVPTRPDNTPRDPSGAARDFYTFFDANKTALAAGMREAKRIVERPAPSARSTLENLSRGLRPLMGPQAMRSVQFNGKPFTFQGPDISKGPLFDLVHAVGAFARYPETGELLEVLAELIEKHEEAAASPVKMGLAIDALADDPRFASAQLIGIDGTPNSPHEWWDDAIGVGIRMLSRPGMLQAVIKSFSDPVASVQGELFATWMKYKDDISYKGAPMTLGGPHNVTPAGNINRCEAPCYDDAQKQEMNTPILHTYEQEVDRSQPDVGMNRSVWQRILSLIHALNDQKICNKMGAHLAIHGVTGLELTDAQGIGIFRIPVGYPTAPGYKECEVIEILNAVEIYSQAVLEKATISIKDDVANILGAATSIIVGTVPMIQERESQLTGFNDKPTPQSMARFMFAPRSSFMNNVLPETLTADGAPILKYEPNALFHMEVPVATALFNGVPQSFIMAGKPLLNAFDTTEKRDAMKKLADGYMFGHMLDAFHKHWSSRKSTPCTATVAPGQEGCTQSLDSNQKFYSPQTNLVSYEPLLIEALTKHDLMGVLQRAAAALKTVTVNGKDGLTILADFAARMFTPDPELTYRDGRKFAMTNTCAVPAGTIEPPAACDCPAGSTAVDPAKPASGCAMPTGTIVPRGRIVQGGIPSIYLALDALKGFDKIFDQALNEDRLDPWRAARSSLVDQFLTAEADPAADGKNRLQNQRGRQIGIKAIRWFASRLAAHKADQKTWAATLSKDFEETFGHPIVAGLLDVLDKGWESEGAGQELARVSTYLMDPANAEAFAGLVVAVADTLTFVDRDKDLTPVIQFASLALAPNSFEAYDTGAAPNTKDGVVSAALSLSNKVISLDTTPQLSTIGRILKNAALPNPVSQETPLDILFDAAADVNRVDPNQPTTVPFRAVDNHAVFNQVQDFMLDVDRGLERLYLVIQNRKRGVNYPSPQVKAK